ncbi:hypothetical protein AMTR_s00048p00149790 [Amborella trichopoda]|uniref:Uncharacterized protein n=1 Tax=Amborella trichopoda TaxID=13333 RepID=U5D2G2_AMBTC|nr:hypothetical protein AMTR_s00048p00149790 [Amborella trichopoda]
MVEELRQQFFPVMTLAKLKKITNLPKRAITVGCAGLNSAIPIPIASRSIIVVAAIKPKGIVI